MNSTMQGLEVSLLALIITFLALGVFILVMVVLQRIFPPRAEEGQEAEIPQEEPVLLTVNTADESEEGAVAAAIVVALSYYRSAGRVQLGGALNEGRGAWWVSRRAEARQGRVERR